MKIKKLILPVILILLGVIACVVASLLVGMQKAPTITKHDFPYSVTYTLDGETKTLEGVYTCEFKNFGNDVERIYEGSFVVDGVQIPSRRHVIAEKDGWSLCIVIIFSDRNLMGDAGDGDAHYDPYLSVVDAEDSEYYLEEKPGLFEAELVEWTYPESVENTFEFSGFAELYVTSMEVMVLVGLVVILLCVILVKKDPAVTYQVVDKLSIGLNVAITLVAIPIMMLCAAFGELFSTIPSQLYTVCYCIPAIAALSVAASLCLRRKGFAKTGFIAQFAGIALFILSLIVDTIPTLFR